MRVRIKKTFYYAKQNRNLRPGDVVNVPEDEAGIWLHHGMAMQDKSVDVPEMKGEVIPGVEMTIESFGEAIQISGETVDGDVLPPIKRKRGRPKSR